MERPTRSFFEGYTPRVAEKLLGMRLVRVVGGTRLAGIIVEVEAYRGFDDPASHAYPGMNRRNGVMFGQAGNSYVYFTYGFHHCLNVTTEPLGIPAAVLIRAIQPVEGVESMLANRRADELTDIASGPGKLTQAMGIDRKLNGMDLTLSGELFLELGVEQRFQVARTGRIGVDRGREFRWRFFIEGNRFVSRTKPTPIVPAQNP